ncbi:hypothetical protein ACFP2F_01585 [Hymenobacter artigasi]|uniref:DUF3575 domain-containing protein n=1 Tax=Hymenobacter artigasi TaxID=2719616 RepID=A0ABX1HC22_9BACT|nr:hypothetical protein [Hymenobacter artigasi]NKI87740.1 hypothetical protein [Hymenobacter artigasi]
MLAARILRTLVLSASLPAGFTGVAHAQTALAQSVPALPAAPTQPKLTLKAGMRLTHLFCLPGTSGTWQVVLPSSFGIEYRLKPHFSLYALAEADISAGRAPWGRRGAAALPTPTTDVSVGTRYYFNEASSAHPWGNYLALEGTAELSQLAVRGRGRKARPSARFTPGVFVLCGTQHRGPGRRLLYDLNAGLGIQAPPAYTTDAAVRPPWDVAAQLNLRVYLVNQPHSSRQSRR